MDTSRVMNTSIILKMFAEDPAFTVERDFLPSGEKTGVVILRLNRPKNLNALTESLGDSFQEKISELAADNTIRSVILTGNGRAFSAGGDISFLRARLETSPPKNVVDMRKFYARFLSIRNLPVPVISAINGPAIGAGCCLALATDIRVAAEEASMGLNFVRLGIHPGMAGSHTLPLIVGQQAASRLLLTGDVISGKEAKELGLVLDSVPLAHLMSTSLHMARKIASNSPVAVRSTLKTLRARIEEGLDRALQREADAQAINYAQASDFNEGLNAISEKRDPNFKDYF